MFDHLISVKLTKTSTIKKNQLSARAAMETARDSPRNEPPLRINKIGDRIHHTTYGDMD